MNVKGKISAENRRRTAETEMEVLIQIDMLCPAGEQKNKKRRKNSLRKSRKYICCTEMGNMLDKLKISRRMVMRPVGKKMRVNNYAAVNLMNMHKFGGACVINGKQHQRKIPKNMF